MRIGIITHYYKSTNYGGNLQAYALCTYLKRKGCHVEQICYKPKSVLKTNYNIYEKCIRIIKELYSKWVNRRDLLICLMLYQRKRAIFQFNIAIPHSSKVYTPSTIAQCKNDYDVFITGSDQIWHPNTICNAYLLNFVEQNGIRISYAASLAVRTLLPKQIELLKNALPRYEKISVREKSAVNLLGECTNKKIDWVVDPTLLLTKGEWDNLCGKRIIMGNYVFCYFLGEDINERKLAKKFAQKSNLKIVTIPYLNNHYRKCDNNFGDICLSKVSPNIFLNLIKYADYIFTDSFHGTIFSGIFNRHFVVFGRAGYAEMDERIKSLLKLFNAENCFCNSDERISLEYIETIFSKTAMYETNSLKEIINFSKHYLEEVLDIK